MNKIHVVNIPQIVKVRKYDVPIEELKQLLRSHKNMSNRKIAEYFDIPITKVEHWFRADDCFAIPDDALWFDLKKLLGISTNKYDACITEFEYRYGVYEKSDRCYEIEGLCPTLTCSDEIKILINEDIHE